MPFIHQNENNSISKCHHSPLEIEMASFEGRELLTKVLELGHYL